MMNLHEKTVITSGKMRQAAFDLLNEQTHLLAWQQSGRVPAELFDEWLSQADALYSTSGIKINDELLQKAPKLKVISQASVGYDNIDIAACKRRGIAVANTPGVSSPAVADLAYGLIIDSARRIARGWTHVQSGLWGERKGLGFGVDLAGKTVGIVGMGGIGSLVAKRVQASAMKVIYYNRHRRADDVELGAEYVSFEELLKRADFVVVTAPLNAATKGLFNAETFAAMKPQSRFINVARGAIVDTDALFETLHSGHLAYAGLDVTIPEPLPGDHKLLTLNNITVTPHIASSTVETRDAMAVFAAQNVLYGLQGLPLRGAIE